MTLLLSQSQSIVKKKTFKQQARSERRTSPPWIIILAKARRDASGRRTIPPRRVQSSRGGGWISQERERKPHPLSKGRVMNVRSVRAVFNRGTVTPFSPLTDLDHVGPYLSRRLEASLPTPTPPPLSVLDFVSTLSSLETKEGKRLLQESLQNDKKNVCSRGYHIRDVNLFGWTTLTSLLRFASTRPDLFPGLTWNLDPTKLPSPPKRGEAAKRCGCHTATECRSDPSCEYLSGGRLCVPRRERIGFEGVGERPGQIEPLQRERSIREERGSLSYARGRDRFFRRPTRRTRRTPQSRRRSPFRLRRSPQGRRSATTRR